MEFLVEFDIHIPEGTPDAEVEQGVSAEAAGAAELARKGHLVRLWRRSLAPEDNKVFGLYRADNRDDLLFVADNASGLMTHG